MAEWHNVRYKIVWNQDTESTQMPPWQSPSWLVNIKFYITEFCASVINTSCLVPPFVTVILSHHIVTLQFHQSCSSTKLKCQLFKCVSATYTAHHHRNKTCIHTLDSLCSNNSHFILNISITARFKLVGKKRTKKMAPAKQGQ
jgi:hypothetical protein